MIADASDDFSFLPGGGGLFATGRIMLLEAPVSASWGIHKHFSMLESGAFGIRYDPSQEYWIISLNRQKTRCTMLHVDSTGYSLTRRILFQAGFRAALSGEGARNLTRGQLRRLFADGTVEGPYSNPYIAAAAARAQADGAARHSPAAR